jgi:NAD(P)-dependent dehydrogenase (short-subunit alcohol dehydrogenase family)
MAGALVTGGTRGIGLECARTLRRLGLGVAVCSRDPEDVAAVAGEVDLARACDVTDRDAIGALANEAAAALDGLAVVIANAGVLTERALLVDTPVDVWESTLRVNVVGVANTLAAATPHLRRSRGYAFVISSIAGHEGMAEFSSYSASKWGLRGLTRSFIQEEAPKGVRATVISPGLVDTRMGEAAGFGGERLRPSDVAATVEWCLALSPAALVREVVLERMAAV